MEIEAKSHTSYSEIYAFDFCPFNHKIKYVDKVRSESIYLKFGVFLHEAIDRTKKTGLKTTWITFGKKLIRWMKANEKLLKPQDKIDLWVKQGFSIYNSIFDWLEKEFPGHEFVDSEYKIDSKLENDEDGWSFVGYIDLIIKDKEGIYHILDFKTTGWGWGIDKRSDTKRQYQLTLYKLFFCKQANIDPDLVKTHFLLLKRQPKKGDAHQELFSITSGKKKIENANTWMLTNLRGIKKGVSIKNRNSCKNCEWHKTPHCP